MENKYTYKVTLQEVFNTFPTISVVTNNKSFSIKNYIEPDDSFYDIVDRIRCDGYDVDYYDDNYHDTVEVRIINEKIEYNE